MMRFHIYIDVKPPTEPKAATDEDTVIDALCAHLNGVRFDVLGDYDERTGETPADKWEITRADDRA